MAAGLLGIATGVVGLGPLEPATAEASIADDDWLGIVNAYRSMSGLDPVTANATWSAEAAAHSCYMLLNGISHDEVPGNPGYTPGGDIAGNSGNVAVSSAVTADARDHIDLWMTGPFHAIGILRHNLTSTGFGLCTDDDTPTVWHSGGTLDVIRGLDLAQPRPSTPILFPGDGATVPLTRFITEYPDPMAMCGWDGTAGLPLIAMLPDDVTSASATLEGPDGPIDTCVLHAGNVSDAIGKAILGGDDAVIVMPRAVLTDGTYHAAVASDGGNVSWSFTADEDASLSAVPLAPPDMPETTAATNAHFEPVTPFRLVDSRNGRGATRLTGGATTRIDIGDASAAAVSANFVAVQPSANGFLTAFACPAERPTVSTLNFRAGAVIANQAIVPVDDGEICVYSKATTDIVIDVNGYFRSGADGAGFVAATPERLIDTRETARLQPGRVLEIPTDHVAPDATAVAVNVTAIRSAQAGWLKLYPCGSPASAEISSINYGPAEIRPNSAVVPVGDGGKLCATSLRELDITIDFTGYFGAKAGLDFVPLVPIRLFDSRSLYADLNPATYGRRIRAGATVRLAIAGQRGIPADAQAVSVNVAATEPLESSFVTVFPCGARPATANLNISPRQATTANGAMVKLSSDGDLCVFTRSEVHVIVDVNGIWR